MASAHNPIVSAVLLRSSVVKKYSLGVRSPIRLADHLQLKNRTVLGLATKGGVMFMGTNDTATLRLVGQFAEVTDTELSSPVLYYRKAANQLDLYRHLE